MNIEFHFIDKSQLLCAMNKLLQFVFAATVVISFSSCTSEYEERLQKAKKIRAEIIRIEQESKNLGIVFDQELKELQTEIQFHARVSGNEDLFFKELMNR